MNSTIPDSGHYGVSNPTSRRQEHLEWCKERAREYLDRGDVVNGIASMLSDINKHEETQLDSGSALSSLGMLYVMNNDMAGARRFVEGFN